MRIRNSKLLLSAVLGLSLVWPAAAIRDDRVFESPNLGLAFFHPKSWIFKQKKHSVEFTIPLYEGKSQAKVEIFENTFRGTADLWQQLQGTAAKSQGAGVEKQWREDYLGVPMLLTKLTYVDRTVEMAAYTGLLYTRTPNKFQFRLAVPRGNFDDAEAIWKAALLTLRTIDGSLPLVEDPPPVEIAEPGKKPKKPKKPDQGKPTDTARVPDAPLKPSVTIVLHPAITAPMKGRFGSEKLEVQLAGQPSILRYEKGWTVTKVGDKLRFTHARASGIVTVDVLSTIDSLSPENQLVSAPSKTLSQFKSVSRREDPAMFRTAAGYRVATVLREGKSEAGDLVLFYGIGSFDNHYWLVEYRSESMKQAKDDLKLIRSLMETLGLQPNL